VVCASSAAGPRQQNSESVRKCRSLHGLNKVNSLTEDQPEPPRPLPPERAASPLGWGREAVRTDPVAMATIARKRFQADTYVMRLKELMAVLDNMVGALPGS